MSQPDPISKHSVHNLLAAHGLSIRPCEVTDWGAVLERCAYVPVDYTLPMVRYQHTYLAAFRDEVIDASVTLWHENQVAGVWPLTLSCQGGNWTLGSSEGALLPPLLTETLSPRTQKRIVQQAVEAIQALGAAATRATSVVCREIQPPRGSLSEWHRQCMSTGASARLVHELFTELSLPVAELRASYRKSYRALINQASRLWQAHVLRDPVDSVWERFRQLHIRVSGRETRPKATWDVQLDAVRNGAAFLVYLLDEREDMVGGGLFHTSRDEGLYAVGAYDRTLFAKPVGHLVQHHAILEMKQRGLQWYRIGARPYPGDRVVASNKEMAIADFKQGFATHQALQLMLELPCTVSITASETSSND